LKVKILILMKLLKLLFFTIVIIIAHFSPTMAYTNINYLPTADFVITPATNCVGSSITLTDNSSTSGGSNIISWIWIVNGQGASFTLFNGQIPPNLIFSISGTDTISLTVIDNLSNVSTISKIINIAPSPLVSAGADKIICLGSFTSIGAAPLAGFTYSWLPATGLSNSNIANPIASPASSTIYTLSATFGGCTVTDQVVVNNIGQVIANAGTDASICSGTSTSIGANGTALINYSWSPSNNLTNAGIANPVANPSATTSYVLTASAFGCFDKDTVVVTVNATPIANVGPIDSVAACSGSIISIGANAVAGLTYSWLPTAGLSNPFIANPTVTLDSNIVYTLLVTNASLCQSSKSIKIDTLSIVKAFAGLDQTICQGNSISLGGTPIVASGGTGNYIFKWSPFINMNDSTLTYCTVTPIVTTTYFVLVSDVNINCGSSIDSVVVFVTPLPDLSISSQTIFCQQDPASLLVANTPGGTFYGIGVNSSTNTFDPSHPSIIVGTPFLVTYKDTVLGCPFENSTSVLVNANPIANAGLDGFICTNFGQTSAQLNGLGGVSFNWSPATSLNNSTLSFPIASPTATTTYFLTVTLNGCVATDSVMVYVSNNCLIVGDTLLEALPDNATTFVNTPVNINILNNDIYNKDSVANDISVFASPSNGTLAITNQQIQYSPNPDFIGLDTFVYTLCDTLNSLVVPYKCDTAIVFITIFPVANPDLNIIVNCNDTLNYNLALNDQIGNGNYPFIYTILDSTNNGQCFLNSNTLTYIPANGFEGVDSIAYQVCVNGLCVNSIATFIVSCSIQLPIAINDNASTSINTNVIIPILANDSLFGGSFNQILINPLHGTAIYDTASNTIIYTPSLNFVGNDSFIYIICNLFGCDTATVYVTIDAKPATPVCNFSSGFSPNNDGINDEFTIACASNYPNNKFRVFNRWGTEVFNATSFTGRWDALYRSNPLPDGTYYFIFEFNNNILSPQTGFIVIQR
jgi:gliding motility-associated-like protein